MNARKSSTAAGLMCMALLAAASAAAGCGGGNGHDHGHPSGAYPAFTPAPGQAVKGPGAVMTAPRFTAITFPNDPYAGLLEDFTARVGGSTWWATVTSDYGVGIATATSAIEIAETPAATITDDEIQAFLKTQLTTTSSGWPAPSENSLYILYYPDGVKITGDATGTSCVEYLAYHGYTVVNGINVPYAVVPSCGGYRGMSALDVLTDAASHEMIEAATDPVPPTGYANVDANLGGWAIYTGLEVGDLCERSQFVDVVASPLDYVVQRIWSNTSAAAGHDPCVPRVGRYFIAQPVASDKVLVSVPGSPISLQVNGVRIPAGASRDVELDLFSDGDTGGPWLVTAKEILGTPTQAPALDLSLDRDQGVNGEKLWLHIHHLHAGSESVLITSSQGGFTHSVILAVGSAGS
ncbi:MAG TPA: hypothetical protein VMV18_10810 [bacterium]|nr:hypothetical protein [bacterium]